MTSKKELERQRDGYRKNYTEVSERLSKVLDEDYQTEQERDAFKAENDALYDRINSNGDANATLVQFIEDIFTIEPQLKHLLTHGVWDFERVHRAAEHLRGEDALDSVGYTSDCVEIDMSNVIPFPTDPDSTYRGAA